MLLGGKLLHLQYLLMSTASASHFTLGKQKFLHRMGAQEVA